MQTMKHLTRRLSLINKSRFTHKIFGLRAFSQTITNTINNKTKMHQNVKYSNNAFLNQFYNQVTENGDNNALICDDSNISYSEFYRLTLQTALYFSDNYNIKQGDVITAITSNVPQIKSVIIACQMLNCAFFPINPNLSSSIIDHYINSTNSKLILYDDTSTYKNDNVNMLYISSSIDTWIGDHYASNTNISLMESILTDIIKDNDYNNELLPSLMMSTSGSTAIPKIVVHSNRSSQLWMSSCLNDFFTKKIALLTSQSHHVSTYMQLINNISNAGCLVYPSKIMRNINTNNTQKVLEMLRLTDLYNISSVGLVVTPIYELVKLNKSFGNSVDTLFCGGDIIPTQLMAKFVKLHSKNPSTMIMNAYGSTEVGLIGMSTPLLCNEENSNDIHKIENDLMCINKTPNIEYKIDQKTNELLVKTSSMMTCYHNEPQKTSEAFTSDGYYKMGDTINIMNENIDDNILKFQIISRNKQVIVSENGYYIFPQNIENILLSHNKVTGAIIVGISSSIILDNNDNNDTYSKPIGFITINEDLNNDFDQNELIDELLLMLSNKLNASEIPYKLFIIDNLPKSSVGKIERNKLTNLAIKYFKNINKKHQQEIFTLFYNHESHQLNAN